MQFFDRLLQTNHKTPAFELTLRDKATDNIPKPITWKISDSLINLTLTDSRGFEADQLDITLDDADGRFDLPSRGAILGLSIGWQGEPLVYKGEYTVDEVEHSGSPDIITIRARAADMRGSLMNRYERSFDKKTIGDIVAQIADENQLKPLVDNALKSVMIDHIDQTNESSINLLTRLAEQYDAIATVKNGNLLFITAGAGKTASGKPLPTIRITRADGDSHRFAVAEGDNYKAVKAYWHDTDTGKRGEVIWDKNTELKRTHKQNKGRKLKSGKVKGAGKSKRVYLEVHQKEPVESDTDKIKSLPHTYASRNSAIDAVKRVFGKLERGVASFSLTLATGNPELMPELPVQVVGFKRQIDSSKWIITQVTHSINDSGFTTQIECELKVESDGE